LAKGKYSVKGIVSQMLTLFRYVNTNYALASLLRHVSNLLPVILSYDINCQYNKNFGRRMTAMGAVASLGLNLSNWNYAIPKLHIRGHITACQAIFVFHFLPGGAETDGEGIERQWAHLGPIETSTKEMVPGHRHDVIDDHLHHWVWEKLMRTGTATKKKLLAAQEEAQVQGEDFEEFSAHHSEIVDG